MRGWELYKFFFCSCEQRLRYDAQRLRPCVPTFILAGQSNTLGHNIEARDLPPWLRALAAFQASVVTMGMNASRCDRYGGAFATATDADPVAPKPPREPVQRKASCAEDLDGCGGPRGAAGGEGEGERRRL